MVTNFPSVAVHRVVPLADSAYHPYVLSAIRRAHWRVWASIFIIDPRTDSDPTRRVRSLLLALAEAKEYGLSVRLLVGDSESAAGIRYRNSVAQKYARDLGIRVRRHTGGNRSSTHDKYVLVDSDELIVGSHNWTHRALDESHEDSWAIVSREMSIWKTLEFQRHWATGEDR